MWRIAMTVSIFMGYKYTEGRMGNSGKSPEEKAVRIESEN